MNVKDILDRKEKKRNKGKFRGKSKFRTKKLVRCYYSKKEGHCRLDCLALIGKNQHGEGFSSNSDTNLVSEGYKSL